MHVLQELECMFCSLFLLPGHGGSWLYHGCIQTDRSLNVQPLFTDWLFLGFFSSQVNDVTRQNPTLSNMVSRCICVKRYRQYLFVCECDFDEVGTLLGCVLLLMLFVR